MALLLRQCSVQKRILILALAISFLCQGSTSGVLGAKVLCYSGWVGRLQIDESSCSRGTALGPSTVGVTCCLIFGVECCGVDVGVDCGVDLVWILV